MNEGARHRRIGRDRWRKVHADYLELLDKGVVLITPTRRLAGLIADRYHAAMLIQGLSTWEAPRVLPFGAWLADTFQRLALTSSPGGTGAILLSVDQERVIWEQVVRELGDLAPDQVEAMTALAMNAWSTLLLWDVPLTVVKQHGGRNEVRAFLRWAEHFEQRCGDLAAIDQHRYAAELAVPGTCLAESMPAFRFVAYSRLPTLLKRIARRFETTGHGNAGPRSRTSPAFACRVFSNTETEISTVMARAAEEKRCRPRASVLVALANAPRVDVVLEQRLARAFYRGVDTDQDVRGLTLSCPSAVSLADFPLVKTAISILDRRHVRAWDELSRLLLSPYLGDADAERGQRALLDHQLRRGGDVEVAISSVIDAVANGSVTCPRLGARLAAMLKAYATMPGRQSMHAWMTFAQNLLNAVGWPGDRPLSGIENAVMVEWRRVMDSAAQLDAVVPASGWQTAFACWRDMLRRRRISPPTDVNAVEVVTLEEAAFLDADALWVAGLHDGAWPPSIDINPLLPFAPQREYGIPGADPERELNHAQAVLDHLLTRHENAICSYASLEGEIPRRALAGATCIPIPSKMAPAWPRREMGGRFELIDDTYSTPLQGQTAIGGGVALFTDQSACPFRAVARHRLAAYSPQDASPGLNGMQRGSLIHALMAAFWSRMNSSASLAGAGEEHVRQTVAACALEVVDEYRRHHRLPDAYWDLERTRLSELGWEWLRAEADRGEFEVVACEQARTAEIGGYTINIRIDRIDRLANGSVIIIDYKTGGVPRSSWSVPRPDQPQLPLYAVSAVAEGIAGVVFARVKKGDCRIVDEPPGVAGGAALSREERSEWNVRLEQWGTALSSLAEEITRGFALADPKRGSATCRHCDLQCFCRIHESQPNLVMTAEDED